MTPEQYEAALTALRKVIEGEWPSDMTIVEVVERNQFDFGHEPITDDEVDAVRAWVASQE